MKKLGEWTETSPKKLEHVFKGHTGTMGAYLLSAVDVYSRWAMDEPERPDMRLHEYPGIKAFWKGADPARSVQGTSDIYDQSEKVGQIYGSIRFMAVQGKIEEMEALVAESAVMLKHLPLLNQAKAGMALIRKELNQLDNNRVLLPEVKREKRNELNQKINDIGNTVSKVTSPDFQ